MKAVADRQVAPWRLRLLSAFLLIACAFLAVVVPAISYHPHMEPHGPQEHHTAQQVHDRDAPVESPRDRYTQLESLCASIDGCHPAGYGLAANQYWSNLRPGGQGVLDRQPTPYASADLAQPLRPPNARPSWSDEGWRPGPTRAQGG